MPMPRSSRRNKIMPDMVAKRRPANDTALMPLVLRQTRAWLGERTAGQAAILAFLIFAVGISAGLSLLILIRMDDQRLVQALPVPAAVPAKPDFGITVTDRADLGKKEVGTVALHGTKQGAKPDDLSGVYDIILPLDHGLKRALLDTTARAVGDDVSAPPRDRDVAAEDDGNDIKRLRRAVRLNPRNATAQLALAQAFREAGDADGAEEALLLALDHDQKNLRYHLALARLYDQMGRGRDALAEYRWLLNAPEAGRANFPLDDIANRADFLAAKMGGR